MIMRFYHEPREDIRRYNDPTLSETAAVFESSDGAPPSHRHISVYPKKGDIQRIDYDSMHCDPMAYVLIWPYGEPGCFNPVLSAGKLTQQLIVDYYCRIEGDRLKYIRNQQSKLRVDTYSGLADALRATANEANVRVGKLVVLPSSFIGSPRNMVQNYQDAMAIVRKFGKPDLFITFTCNASWPEITTSIHSYETANNRPDIVVRVFHAKVEHLLKIIKTKKIFGDVKTYIYTIEFQKRGLPHVHLLVGLEDHCKVRNVQDIDRVVSAEIPDPNHDSTLYNLVKKHNIHGPCGSLNLNNVCMENGKCKKEFPKQFSSVTKENYNGYPVYMRRDNGQTISKTVNGKCIDIDNRYVVPYNPFLLKYFEAHINVEICASVHSVKYLQKYIYKGHDCANLQVTVDQTSVNHDEVTTYLNTRYVGSCEAAYRIFSYNMHEQSHTIVRLAVHLPDQQQVYFTNDNAAEALMHAELKSTTLIGWLNLNNHKQTKSPYSYPETPMHYVWNGKQWKKRVKYQPVIGRMYHVSPSDSERYYLRLLLLHVIGAKSFEDIRTYNGITFPTFKEAAKHRNLLSDD
ncbi:hypothetical protein QTP88_021130 [Uroleucon formosanum]